MSELITAVGIDVISGPMTHEMVVQAHGHWSKYRERATNAVAAAPDAVTALSAFSLFAYAAIGLPRHNILPEFDPEAMCGEGGAWLREAIVR